MIYESFNQFILSKGYKPIDENKRSRMVNEAFALRDTEKVIETIRKYVSKKIDSKVVANKMPFKTIVKTANGKKNCISYLFFPVNLKGIVFKIHYLLGNTNGQIQAVEFSKISGKRVSFVFDTSNGRMYNVTTILPLITYVLNSPTWDFKNVSLDYLANLANGIKTTSVSESLVYEGRVSKLSPSEMEEFQKLFKMGIKGRRLVQGSEERFNELSRKRAGEEIEKIKSFGNNPENVSDLIGATTDYLRKITGDENVEKEIAKVEVPQNFTVSPGFRTFTEELAFLTGNVESSKFINKISANARIMQILSWVRRGIIEPIVNVPISKKVEDGEDLVDLSDVNINAFDNIEKFTKIIGSNERGTLNGMIICGRAGTGKTQTVTNTLKQMGLVKFDIQKKIEIEGDTIVSDDDNDEYNDTEDDNSLTNLINGNNGDSDFRQGDGKGVYNYDFYAIEGGKVTPSSLFRAFYENKDKIVIIDDADDVISKPGDGINMLKGAMGTAKKRIVTWSTGRSFNPAKVSAEEAEKLINKGIYPSYFSFTGKVIFISNLNMEDFDEALRSRSYMIDVDPTQEEMFKRIEDNIEKLLPEFTVEEKMDTLNFLRNKIMGKKFKLSKITKKVDFIVFRDMDKTVPIYTNAKEMGLSDNEIIYMLMTAIFVG